MGGLPIREADYQANSSLVEAMPLPENDQGLPPGDMAQASQLWSKAIGGQPVVLARSIDQARQALLAAAEIPSGATVALPANATRSLVEAVKRHGARPYFVNLNADLAMHVDAPDVALTWGQPVAGLPQRVSASTRSIWLDYTDTLPSSDLSVDVGLYNLHLSANPAESGALLVFQDAALAEKVKAQLEPLNQPDPTAVLAQYRRFETLARAQKTALAESWRGLFEAAGLPLFSLRSRGALAHGVAVQIPSEIDIATYYAYVKAENTPVQWLPMVRPLHYAAATSCQSTAAHLARWMLVPIGPNYSTEEIAHAILGVVKAADYLGVRWIIDPAWAAEYAAMMDDWYGPDHDAYRPIFGIVDVKQSHAYA
ncbi:MAG: hypothetical protein AAF485_00760 [Chloroflexota bacterium]